ncbi:MAG: ABC transporter ATP-binding protein [Candidatus Marinimicrobia bacterium]|nr:ABC transporter ATP-binding protein [Candidatus Neomarinimicrobiota bacterium]MCF7827801.1 ABC transporter ATP-binding protein [Candidatus Neomarinimicrobiota bacterium]MCF7879444.1 ABC transporter ATP-binding protein [Candidatus Neomarinimicrobiota bacterium]
MITVRDLTFSYPGNERFTLDTLNFSVNDGEILGFLGPSGAGKSTTQSVLIGILKRYAGSVQVLGQELSNISPDFYEQVGVAFEFPNFYSKFTAMENLDYFAALYKDNTANPGELLEMVGLSGDANTRVGNFSKGMKMRLNFCRAFLNNPKLVFLDEPTAGLDPVNARKIRDIVLKKRDEGVTVFLTTHNMHVADELCDRVAFIVDGELVLCDSPRELKLRDGKKLVRVEYQLKGQTETRDFPIDSLGENAEFLNILRKNQVETIHTQEASLEDVFIKTTGRRLV